jgi:hypothetical protein
MTDIYDLHTKAFQRVSAYVIARNGERVATIAFKFPADGAGRLYAYVHWFGAPMVRGFAGGYGYDKRSAAVESALPRMKMAGEYETRVAQEAFIDALRAPNGHYFDRKLEHGGFTVWQAV